MAIVQIILSLKGIQLLVQVFLYNIYFQNIFIIELNITIVTNSSAFTGWNIFWDSYWFKPQIFGKKLAYGTQNP